MGTRLIKRRNLLKIPFQTCMTKMPPPLTFKLDEGFGSDATLGLIVLQADETLENEFRTALGTIENPSRIAVYHSRIPSQPTVTKETLAQMQRDLPSSAALLAGKNRTDKFSAIAYCCTSGMYKIC